MATITVSKEKNILIDNSLKFHERTEDLKLIKKAEKEFVSIKQIFQT